MPVADFQGAGCRGKACAVKKFVVDMVVPEEKPEILSAADKEVREIQDQFANGLVTNGERYNKVIDIWAQATERITSQPSISN